MDEHSSNQKRFITETNFFYEDLIGYKPEKIILKNISEKNWNNYSENLGFNKNSFGIYFPRNQTAIIRDKNPLSLFHEYFGHGLYCEQNLIGRKLVDLEKKLLEEEKQEFSSKNFNLDDLQKFRKQNQTFQELENFRKENLGKYELFAIYTEYLLSKENDLMYEFEKKYNSLCHLKKETIDSVINFSTQYGNLATMYAQGMARKITPERVKKLLGDIYKNKFKNSKLILLTGSKKPFSDIDLFVSSNEMFSIKNEWLDLVSFSEQDFEKRIELFECQVTHPMIKGELIFGDRVYFEKLKLQLNEQPITEEAIAYNFMKSLEQKNFALCYSENSPQRKIGLSYAETYLATALALKEGKRLFTKEDLLLYSQSEINRELKGGKKNEI